ncbi:substrate-binding periplasmic protein [Rhodoferax saidenbachensis]|uniref:ABC transporter substrate-binding protein n=1 Tax=Rhodoferax saidenbachensis TaxID=1484693 RepID=A0A1P8K7F5_9BURK|nr:transporter substrate-binding domain-containing protein [Rhodoferax saidenbachensis]APW41886.1 ABC transporter substrate-binding protein [Rhodoferax saidenbachensis]
MVGAQTLVLAAADSVPTAYVEHGKQTGLLVDVITEVFKRIGYPVDIAIMPWARCLAEAKAGRIDGIFSVYQTRERQEFLTYADEVLITQVQALFVRKDSAITFDGDLSKLSELRLGIINQTSYGPRLDAALERGVFKRVDVANSVSASLNKLLHDRIDLIPSYRHVALDSARTMGAAGSVKELTPAIEAIPSYLAFSNKKDYAKVIGAYNQALRAMKKDGTYDAIFNKYLVGEVRRTNPDVP